MIKVFFTTQPLIKCKGHDDVGNDHEKIVKAVCTCQGQICEEQIG